jgi:hypothetical protein
LQYRFFNLATTGAARRSAALRISLGTFGFSGRFGRAGCQTRLASAALVLQLAVSP